MDLADVVPLRLNGERRAIGLAGAIKGTAALTAASRSYVLVHTRSYPSRLTSLQKDVAAYLERIDSLRNLYHGEQHRHAATGRQSAARKRQITKLMKRAVAGVCPCCSRYFVELDRHMSAKHPGYATDGSA